MTSGKVAAQPAIQTLEFVEDLPPPPVKWKPVLGGETKMLQDLLSKQGFTQEEVDTIVKEAATILCRCISPSGDQEKNTGLAVGYVQSGKTTNFTMLAAMAADNGFPLVILLAGTTKSLVGQSEGRFETSLQLKSRSPVHQPWHAYSFDSLDDVTKIRSDLKNWNDSDVPPHERKTVLITIMKHHAHIGKLTRLLEVLKDEIESVPVLVIDDEADQAGLNTAAARGEESRTYASILDLRDALPWHSYVQYTATPQAPLLISLIDMLSPDFPVVLTPGHKYTGGSTFFGEDGRLLVDEIPEDQIPTDEEPLDGPPATLEYAMQLFFLGVAVGTKQELEKPGSSGDKNRSMMVHPSRLQEDHGTYHNWVRQIKEGYVQILKEAGPDREDLLAEFAVAYADLMRTVPAIPPFESLIDGLPRRIEGTVVTEMNSGAGPGAPEIEWSQHYSHILIGGQMLDRGFTVKGLTVTYMPRSIGVGNADTIQQRARFFGYKRDYLGYCRVFLDRDALHAFRAYVEHESSIHDQLKGIMNTGEPPLSEWKRVFLLDPTLKPTRMQVRPMPLMRGNYSSGWWWPRLPQVTNQTLNANRDVATTYVGKYDWDTDDGDGRWKGDQIAKVLLDQPLAGVLNELLVEYELGEMAESHRYLGLLLQIQYYLEDNPDALCDIYLMSQGNPRVRGTLADGQVRELFMGANPKGANPIYPGDRQVGRRDRTLVQIHWLTLRYKENGEESIIAESVPCLAVHLPEDAGHPWAAQVQRAEP